MNVMQNNEVKEDTKNLRKRGRTTSLFFQNELEFSHYEVSGMKLNFLTTPATFEVEKKWYYRFPSSKQHPVHPGWVAGFIG